MNLLKMVYHFDTRTIRVFNLIYHSMWLLLLVSHTAGVIIVNIPSNFEPSNTILIYLTILCILTTVPSLTCNGEKRRLFKYISLLFGSLIEFSITYKYLLMYPPFTPMVVISFILGVWLFGGALFIKWCSNDSGVE